MREKQKLIRRFVGILLFCMTMVGIWEMKLPAEAAGTASVTITGGRWISTGGAWEYQMANGVRVKNGIYQINGKLYCFGADGRMDVGWIQRGATWYYANTDGSLQRNAWVYSGRTWYYLKADGKMASDEPVLWKGKYYYLKKGGSMAAGEWVKWRGIYYYAGSDGILVSNTWVKSGGYYYYLQANRRMATDSVVSWNGERYYLDADGKMAENRFVKSKGYYYYAGAGGALYTGGWEIINGYSYYFFGNGVLAVNRWLVSGGKYYYAGSNGRIAKNCWVGDRYVDANGVMLTNQYREGYYLGANGRLQNVERLSGKYIIVGDSRTVQLERLYSGMTSDISYLCKWGAGYTWLDTIAYPQLAATLERNQNKTVVLTLGFNDLGNIDKYIALYRMLKIRYPKTKFYMLSVNPVDAQERFDQYGAVERNRLIQVFNLKMRQAFRSNYLDSYSYLIKVGFATLDSVHYDDATCKKIYQWLIPRIRK